MMLASGKEVKADDVDRRDAIAREIAAAMVKDGMEQRRGHFERGGSYDGAPRWPWEQASFIARTAYDMADAMLEERIK